MTEEQPKQRTATFIESVGVKDNSGTKENVASSTKTSDNVTQPAKPEERDPYHGVGGAYVLDDKGRRVKAQ